LADAHEVPLSPAPVVILPNIKIVGEDEPPFPRKEPEETFVFDPTKIYQQFAGTPAPLPPAPEPPSTVTTLSPSQASNAPIPVVGGEGPAPGSAQASPDKKPALHNNRHNNDRRSQHPHNNHGKFQQPQPHSHNNKQRPPSQHQPQPHQQQYQQGQGKRDKFRNKNDKPQQRQQGRQWGNVTLGESVDERDLSLGNAYDYEALNQAGALSGLIAAANLPGEPFSFAEAYALPVNDLVAMGKALGLRWARVPPRRALVAELLSAAHAAQRPIHVKGTLEILEDGNGLLVYLFDNYRIRELSTFVPKALVMRHGLQRGHEIEGLALPPRENETVPILVRVDKIMGEDPETVASWTPFGELTPYYPTQRIFLEAENVAGGNNLSMRCVDLLCPIGLGQRGLIVAPPRTGKTILLQGIANAIVQNTPQVHLIILLVDERPEEVTDFRRQVREAEIVSSTFDESAESHVHAAEMVIERARRMVEAGRHVVILLDSITRLARAYNTMMPSTGKILSGGVESNALSKPKRFFGSARNIEGGGSLTILGTALIETGSKMDEVIFEEFKGTGNMELDLDRELSNKRIFPAISFERSGTRKEELLYHPDELQKVYSLRRAMKGVPSVEAMEQLIQRIKKTKTNVEFLLTLGR
jgi:transcription termination factor Rho